MENVGHFLFGQVPWLRPVLAWSFSLLIILLLLCVPAYFMLLPFAKRLRQELKDYAERLATRLKAAREDRARLRQAEVDALRDQLSLRHISFAARAQLDRLVRTIGNASRRLARTGEVLPSLTEALESRGIHELSHGPFELPAPAELQLPTARLRVAWATFIVSTLFLLGIVTINTGMLGEILKDLGVVPPTLRLGSLPTYVIFALILSAAEAAIGFVHEAKKPGADEKERVAVWPAICVAFALVIATVEGFFYSQVAPNKDAMFELPIIGTSIKQQAIFFFWGFVLVMALFALGSLWWSALHIIRSGTAMTDIARRLRNLKRDAAARSKALERLGTEANNLSTGLRELHGAFPGTTDDSNSIQAWYKRIQDELERLRKEPPSWAKPADEQLTRSDVEHLVQTAGLWTMLAIVSFGLFSYLGADDIQQLYRLVVLLPAWSASMGAGIAFFCAGLLFFASETVVTGTGTYRKLLVGSDWSRWIAAVIVALFTVGYLAIIWRAGMTAYRGVLWAFHLLLGYMLFASGYHLCPLLNVIPTWLKRLGYMALSLLQTVYLAVVRAAHALAALLEQLAYLFAAPISAIIGKRSGPIETVREIPKAAAQGHG